MQLKREYLLLSAVSLAVGAVAGYFYADTKLDAYYNELMDTEIDLIRRVAEGDVQLKFEELTEAYKEATAAHRMYVGLEPLTELEEDQLVAAKAAEIEQVVLSKEDEPHVQPEAEVEGETVIVEADMVRSAIEDISNKTVKEKMLEDHDNKRGVYVPPDPKDVVYEQPMSSIYAKREHDRMINADQPQPKGGRFRADDNAFQAELRRHIPGNTGPMPEPGGIEMNGDPQNLYNVSVRLSKDEGDENPKQLERASLTYFAGDNVLADERSQEVEPLIYEMIGQDALDDLATDPDITSVYLENEKFDRLFEVTLSEGSYGIEVAGLLPDPNDQPVRRARHGGGNV